MQYLAHNICCLNAQEHVPQGTGSRIDHFYWLPSCSFWFAHQIRPNHMHQKWQQCWIAIPCTPTLRLRCNDVTHINHYRGGIWTHWHTLVTTKITQPHFSEFDPRSAKLYPTWCHKKENCFAILSKKPTWLRIKLIPQFNKIITLIIKYIHAHCTIYYTIHLITYHGVRRVHIARNRSFPSSLYLSDWATQSHNVLHTPWGAARRCTCHCTRTVT